MLRIKQFILSHKNGSCASALLIISMILIVMTSGGDSIGFSLKTISSGTLNALQSGVAVSVSFVTDTVNSINELRKLQDEYQKLQLQLTNYQSIERDLIELRRENSRLRELLNFSESIQQVHLAAKVIARDPSNIFSTLIINRGSAHGVVPNSAVITYQDGIQGLVGKVVEVDRHTSKIIPIIDPASYVAVRTQQSRHEGLAQGLGRGIFIQYMERNAKETLSTGDLIITSGLRSLYPAGIYVGRVVTVAAPDWLPSLEIEAEPIVDFTRIEYVFVLGKDNN